MKQDTPLVDQIAGLSIHRPHQSESLRREIRSLEWALHGRSEHDGQPMPDFRNGGGDDAGNREYIQESLSRTRRLYETHAAERWNEHFGGYEKNVIYQELKRAEREIVEGMPTHEMMQEPTSSNVDWWMAWHKEKKKQILFWRNARRILDPRNDNHNFGNVDTLRKHELTGADPRRYWSGFEQIAFTELAEKAIDQISDEQYYVFLTLKAQDWAPTNIMRKLGWTKPTYEAAMARLRVSAGEPEPEAIVQTPVDDVEPDDDDEAALGEGTTGAPPAHVTVEHPPLLTSSEWHALLEERHITHKTAARYIHMNIHTFKARMAGRGRFTPSQSIKLWELAQSKARASSAA